MKIKIALLTLLAAGAAAAQTTIGNVTITRPSDVRTVTPARTPVTTPPRVTTPARTATPARTTAAPARPAAQASAATAPSDLPSGWRSLQGRVVAPSDVTLPAGSTVQVSIEELAPNLAHRSTFLNVKFGATRLSTPYTLQYNAQRLKSGSIYAVRAKVYDSRGRLLYANNKLHRAPELRSASMNIAVVAQ